MYLILQYIKFLLRATNQHGVHSPFVYKLITACFYDTKKHGAYTQLSAFRNKLYKSDLVIFVDDFGAGSRIFKSNARQVSKIAKTAGITQKRAQLLYRLTHYLKPKRVLELGTSLGMATSALHHGHTEAQIITIEGCKETAEVAKTQFEHCQFKRIECILSEFNTAFKLDQIRDTIFDLIYLDGNHTKEATLHYFKALLPNTTNDSVMIFDDIHWSEGMTSAWDEIKQHPKVTVTIDTFYWGLVFFRKEQKKEHFSIRL